MIKIGTSGFSYPDWVGPVYPAGLPERQRLAYYARQFTTVEINMTYYRTPDAATVAGWIHKTPTDFSFSVKAHQELTHTRTAPDFASFVAALQPLIEADRLACVLAQFPYSFHATPANRDYLKRLRDGLAKLPVVVEFRDAGWVAQETFDLLRALKLGFCCVDEPRLRGLMPPVRSRMCASTVGMQPDGTITRKRGNATTTPMPWRNCASGCPGCASSMRRPISRWSISTITMLARLCATRAT